MAKVFVGKYINTKSLNEFEAISDGFLAIGENGKIVALGRNYDTWRNENSKFEGEEIYLTSKQFIMPGFVDCHIHAPQMGQIGLGLDMSLLEWLNTYTFPLEAKFKDQLFAEKVYRHVIQSTINSGTTLASYFGSNDKESTLVLAKEALRQGQRALIGKVCSDCNSPDYYIETTEESIESTKQFVEDVKKISSPLVKPIITPRFALSCSLKLLSELGAIAKEHKLHIQSHISESIPEIDAVRSLFLTSYAGVYDNAELLTEMTIMAHAVHLEDEEILLFKKRGTSIAHCPSSNTMLGSGLCDIFRFIKNDVRVGLGTDVSGGTSFSIKDSLLRAIDVSHHLEFIKKQDIKGVGSIEKPDKNYIPLNYKQALYLATLGGAEALTMDDITGNFSVGKDFDGLVIDTDIFPLHDYEIDTSKQGLSLQLLEMVQKFVFVGDDRNIVNVFVAGKKIK